MNRYLKRRAIYQTKTLKSAEVAKIIEFIVDSLITTLDD